MMQRPGGKSSGAQLMFLFMVLVVISIGSSSSSSVVQKLDRINDDSSSRWVHFHFSPPRPLHFLSINQLNDVTVCVSSTSNWQTNGRHFTLMLPTYALYAVWKTLFLLSISWLTDSLRLPPPACLPSGSEYTKRRQIDSRGRIVLLALDTQVVNQSSPKGKAQSRGSQTKAFSICKALSSSSLLSASWVRLRLQFSFE